MKNQNLLTMLSGIPIALFLYWQLPSEDTIEYKDTLAITSVICVATGLVLGSYWKDED